jgi:hypothetical protein
MEVEFNPDIRAAAYDNAIDRARVSYDQKRRKDCCATGGEA